MNAQWVDEYVDTLLTPENVPSSVASPIPVADIAAVAHAPAHSPAPPRQEVPAQATAAPAVGPTTPLGSLPGTEQPARTHDRRGRDAAGASADNAESIHGSTRWLRVCVGVDSYALELLRVQEVLRPVPIVHMRGTPPWTLGVMNLRGRIVPVLDLGAWLGGQPVRACETTRIVVVEKDDELIGIVVSVVEDVVSLQRERRRGGAPSQGGPVLIEDVDILMANRILRGDRAVAAEATVGVARVGSIPTVLLDANRLFA